MWKSILKWLGVAAAEKALSDTEPLVESTIQKIQRRRREEMKGVYWAEWNVLTQIETPTPAQAKRLARVEQWLSKYDATRFAQVVGEME